MKAIKRWRNSRIGRRKKTEGGGEQREAKVQIANEKGKITWELNRQNERGRQREGEREKEEGWERHGNAVRERKRDWVNNK